MYFSAVVGGSSHLWRQRFPDGAPEQITFGPLEEEGIAVAPDGRSLVTSVGMRRSAVWIHDAAGERAIVSEGYALAPRFSRDGTRVFSLVARDWWLAATGWIPASADLRSVDLATGKSDTVLSGPAVAQYVISGDEKDVAFTTTGSDGTPQIWLAPLDRRTSPRLIASNGDSVSFGPAGELIFRSVGESNALVRINTDGTGRERIPTASVQAKGDVSPNGEWVIIRAPGLGKDAVLTTLAVPVNGGVSRVICYACWATWSADGKFFYVGTNLSASSTPAGKTLAIPVPAGKFVAGAARRGNRCGRRSRWTAGHRDDCGWHDRAGTRSLNLSLHQDGLAAQSLSHTPAHEHFLNCPRSSVLWGAPDVDGSHETRFVEGCALAAGHHGIREIPLIHDLHARAGAPPRQDDTVEVGRASRILSAPDERRERTVPVHDLVHRREASDVPVQARLPPETSPTYEPTGPSPAKPSRRPNGGCGAGAGGAVTPHFVKETSTGRL